MAKPPVLENVHVDPPTMGGKEVCAGFIYKGARYHVFVDLATMAIRSGYRKRANDTPTLYKNPVERGLTIGHPDYFNTRRLDATSGANQPLIAELFRQLKAGDLINKAVAAAETAEQQRVADETLAAKLRAIKHSGLIMYRPLVEAMLYLDAPADSPRHWPVSRASLGAMIAEALSTVRANAGITNEKEEEAVLAQSGPPVSGVVTMTPRQRKLLEWLGRASPLLESQIVGASMSKTLDELIVEGLATVAAHPTVKERGVLHDYPATAVVITERGRVALAEKER